MLKRGEYIKTVRRPYPVLYVSLILQGLDLKYTERFLKKPVTVHDLIFIDYCWYYSNKDLNIVGNQVFKEWNSSKKIESIFKILKELENKFLESTKKSYPEFSKAIQEYMPSMITVYTPDQIVNKKLREVLHTKVGPDETTYIMDKLNAPLLDNYYKQEEYDLVTTKNLIKHVKNYEWLNSRFGEIKPYTLKEAKLKLKKINRVNFLENWKKEKIELKKIIENTKKILGSKHSYLVDLMQFIVYYRTQRTDLINRCAYLFGPKLDELAKKKSISYQEILACSNDELLNKVPSRNILKQRLEKFGVLREKDEVRVVIGREYDMVKEFFNERVANQTELNGQIACKGLVSGKAKLIYSTKDFGKIKIGDILITSMTNPHMVPIMKKALAIVTDEGGITCHAAIMSREMKKPCIIGTKIATKVFKDGDMVEVDANKGIVRKIK